MNPHLPAQDAPTVMAIWPGDGARLWEECRKDSLIRAGWGWFQYDLNSFEDFPVFITAYDSAYARRPNLKDGYDIPKNLWQFRNLMPGDLVLAIEQRRLLLAVGQVTAPYRFSPGFKEYRHAIPVSWQPPLHLALSPGTKSFPIKALTPVPPARFEEIFGFPVTQYQRLFGEQYLIDRSFQAMESRLDQQPAIDLSKLKNEQERQWAALCVRRGQSAFRSMLIGQFNGRCPITGCDAEAALEAAHIVSYAESGASGSISGNGILLRSDIHALFDRGLLSIDADTLIVQITMALRSTVYARLEGYPLDLPMDFSRSPLQEALRERIRRTKDGE